MSSLPACLKPATLSPPLYTVLLPSHSSPSYLQFGMTGLPWTCQPTGIFLPPLHSCHSNSASSKRVDLIHSVSKPSLAFSDTCKSLPLPHSHAEAQNWSFPWINGVLLKKTKTKNFKQSFEVCDTFSRKREISNNDLVPCLVTKIPPFLIQLE